MRIRVLPDEEIEVLLREYLDLKEERKELRYDDEQLSKQAQQLHDAFIWANVAYRAVEDESGRCRGLFTRLQEMKQEALDKQDDLALKEQEISRRMAAIEFDWKRDQSRWAKIRRRIDEED